MADGPSHRRIAFALAGDLCGLAARASDEEIRAWLGHRTIAIPGRMTSAYLALQIYLGEFAHIVVPFDQIFDTVKSGRAGAGLIIHEGQLTYERSGFSKVIDLGEWWKRETTLPLPLGGNVYWENLDRRKGRFKLTPHVSCDDAKARAVNDQVFG